jgi:hypothetical protein
MAVEQEEIRRHDGMQRLMSSSSGELQKNHERGDEHSVRDFFVQEKTVFCGQLTGTLVSTTKTVKWVPHWVGLPHSDSMSGGRQCTLSV